jgi:hypothetical protein
MFFEFKYKVLENTKTKVILPYLELYQYLYRTDSHASQNCRWKTGFNTKVFDYFEAESKLSLGESEMNISCMLGFCGYVTLTNDMLKAYKVAH